MKLTTQQLKLRFFDVEANIQTDSRAYLDIFTLLYPRFRVNGTSASLRPPVEVMVLSQPDNPWGKPVVVLDGEITPMTDLKWLNDYHHSFILNYITARVRSHFLIHAGVVAHKGQAALIVADKTYGKTTMVLELVRRGFKFLSDEMAPLGRLDRRVHPFPRNLHIRPGTLERVGFAEAATSKTDSISVLDIETLQPGCMGEAAAINHIVILQDPATAVAEPRCRRELGLVLDRLDEELLTALGQVEGMTGIRPDIVYDYPVVWFQVSRPLAALSQIKALCQEHQIVVLDVIGNRIVSSPTFDQPARLEAIPNSQAVIALLQQFLGGGYQSDILQDEFGGDSTQLFMELATMTSQANCYQLSVGPLHEMADLVCELFDL